MLNYFLFREAPPVSPLRHFVKTVLQTVVFWTIFLAVIPAAVFWCEQQLGWDRWRFPNPVQFWIGIGVFIAGGSLGLTSSYFMAFHGEGTPLPTECARKLVIVGPYRFVRNPMAIAGLSQATAVGLMLGSPSLIVYGVIGAPIWNWIVRPMEEADLEARFGEAYRHYRAAVRCWRPRITPYRPKP